MIRDMYNPDWDHEAGTTPVTTLQKQCRQLSQSCLWLDREGEFKIAEDKIGTTPSIGKIPAYWIADAICLRERCAK